MDIEDYVYKKSGRGYKIQCQCLNCEKEFWVRWSIVKSGGGKYCSYNCTNEHRYYDDPELMKYESRVGESRHIEVKINCELCGKEKWVRWQRVKEGRGSYCSLPCANEITNLARRKNYGKENASFIWDENRGIWSAYWKDSDNIQHTTTKAKWLWENSYGNTPVGYVVTYKDRNPKNCELDNLEIITRGERTSEALMGHIVSDEAKQKMSEAHTGKTLSIGHKRKISQSLYNRWESGEFDDIHVGENHRKWRGGVDGIYPKEFNAELKRKIKERDKDKCRICWQIQERMEVHHMDGNRKNNDMDNLILLCMDCHHRIHDGANEFDPAILAFRSVLII